MKSDRNFDDLADRFEQNIYGKSKGILRQRIIERDLNLCFPAFYRPDNSLLNVLDLGGGLGYFSLLAAKYGHHVIYNDISTIMMDKAQQKAKDEKLLDKIEWSNKPYQELDFAKNRKFDLIFCHAVLEWLKDPEQIFELFEQHLTGTGKVSLCFYNPVGRDYRNLICGNFKLLNNSQQEKSNSGSLTPNFPCSIDQVKFWIAQKKMRCVVEAGIRVFSDYALLKRGGMENEEQVMAMELKYSSKEPYKWMGRYYHVMVERDDTF